MHLRHAVYTLIVLAIGLVVPAGAVAQSSSTPNSTITVPGYGAASAAPDTAIVQIVVGDSAYGGPPQPPAPGSTPGAQERQAVEPVVRALVDQGVDESEMTVLVGPNVQEYMSFGGPATAAIRFTVEAPTAEMMQRLVDAAMSGAAEERMVVGRVTVVYQADDCAALEKEARQMAISDGAARADVQAELLGVTRGELVASRDVPTSVESPYPLVGTTGVNNCSPAADVATLLSGTYAPVSFDPTADPEVRVHVQVELTFEMTVDAAATPAA